jgi:DNA-binding CsgD family transcriptional regulator
MSVLIGRPPSAPAPTSSAEVHSAGRTSAQRRRGTYARRGGAILSRQEAEVLTLIAEGADDGEIAARLDVNAETVTSHLSDVLSKLDARNVPHAVAIAIGQQAIYPRDVIAAGAYSSSLARIVE